MINFNDLGYINIDEKLNGHAMLGNWKEVMEIIESHPEQSKPFLDELLNWAAFDKKLQEAKYLIGKGALPTRNNNEAIGLALSNDDPIMTKLLLSTDIDIKPNQDKNVFLAAVAENNSEELLEILKSFNFDLNSEKAVNGASQYGNMEALKTLIEHGSPITKRARDLAKAKDHFDIVEYLDSVSGAENRN